MRPGRKTIARELVFLTLANHLPRLPWSDRVRWTLYRRAGMRFGGRCVVNGPLTVRPIGGAAHVSIGADSFVNTDVRFAAPPTGPITIGTRAQIGPGVMFETVDHELDPAPGRHREGSAAPIVVGDDVWIGAGAIVLGGVTIGDRSVVAAGAVVTHDVAPGVVVGGIPARVLRTVEG